MSFKIVLRDICVLLAVGSAALALVCVLPAQEIAVGSDLASKASIVPPLVRFAGAATNRAGDTVEAVFRIYGAAEGGEPLWSEAQRVTIGQDGKYSLLLGAATQGGLPAQVFAGGEARWLGVSIERAPEAPRTPLVSVAYAMKAGDAQTVGGVAAGDLVTQAQLASVARQMAAQATAVAGPAPQVIAPTGTGTAGYIPIWTAGNSLGDSVLYQRGTAAVPLLGINTTTPGSLLDVNGFANFRTTVQLSTTGKVSTAAAGVNSPRLAFNASSFLANGSRPIIQTFAWQAVAVNNNTSAPSANMALLYGLNGAAPTPTGLQIFPSGVIEFAPGQNYPGTITSVEPGIGLTGGGTSGDVELTVDTGLVPLMSNANKYTATQSFNAGLTATGITVNGTSTFTSSAFGLTGTSTAQLFNPNTNVGAGVAGFGDTGVYGNGGFTGVYAVASSSLTSARGVFGGANGPSGSAFYGNANGPNGYGVQVYAGGSGGTGVWAYAPGGTGVYANANVGMAVTGNTYGGQVTATASNGVGLSATAGGANAVGLAGAANGYSGIGVTGSGGMAGVSATSPNIGVEGTEANPVGTGTYGVGQRPSNQMRGIFQQVYPQGSLGIWGDTGAARNGSTITVGVLASADNNTAMAAFNASDLATLWVSNYGTGPNTNEVVPLMHATGRSGDCLINSNGDSICSGVHKAAVSVEGGARQVEMYAMHAPENWFEDFGTAQLAGGSVVVKIDPAFAETINGQMEYHVFLTPEGNCEGLYVTNKTATSFEVHELRGGMTSVAFDYRITARRAGHETERMADVTTEMKREPRMQKAFDAVKEGNAKEE